jgi:hypothetical protein
VTNGSNPWEIPAPGASGGKKEYPPVGNHLAVCVAVIDMGHQEQEDMKTGKTYWQWRAYFAWELVGAMIAGTDKNHVIGCDLTLSVKDTSHLYKWVKARTGKAPGAGFNPTSELGQASMLSVVGKQVKDKVYPKVDGMAAIPAMFAKSVPSPSYPLTSISLDEFKTGAKVIPEWVPWLYGSHLADHIKACREIGGQKPQPGQRPAVAGAGLNTAAQLDGVLDTVPY